jgi:hypothetical protein
VILKLLSRRSRAWDVSCVYPKVVVVSRGRTWAVLRLRRPIAKADCGAYAVLLGFSFFSGYIRFVVFVKPVP